MKKIWKMMAMKQHSETLKSTLGMESLGISAMRAGYYGSNDIQFDIFSAKDEFFFKLYKDQIEELMDYMLNEPGCSEKTFNTNLVPVRRKMTAENIQCHRVALFGLKGYNISMPISGGLDSFVSWYMLTEKGLREKIAKVFVNYGQSQYRNELLALERLSTKFLFHYNLWNINLDKYRIMNFQQKKNDNLYWDIDGFKIPARNFMLLSLSLRYLDRDLSDYWICYGVYKGEIMPKNRDKSLEFMSRTSDMFSDYFCKDVKVFSPVMKMEKVDMIKYLADKGILNDVLKYSRTCIASSLEPCYACKPCFNRIMSVVLAGYPEYLNTEWAIRLYHSKVFMDYQNNIDKYTGKRKKNLAKFIEIIKELI